MRDEREEEQKRHVHFRNVRSPEVFVKERVPLQELDHRIDQVGEQDGEGEDYENTTSDIHDNNDNREQQDGQQNVERSSIGESHASPAFKNTPPGKLTAGGL